jgi:hypothetical protein
MPKENKTMRNESGFNSFMDKDGGFQIPGSPREVPMPDPQTTPSQKIRWTQVELAKAIVEQLTALNKSCTQARRVGLRIDFSVEGYSDQTPEIKNIYVVSPTGNVKNIWEDVFQ